MNKVVQAGFVSPARVTEKFILHYIQYKHIPQAYVFEKQLFMINQ